MRGDLKVVGWDRAEVAAEGDGAISLDVMAATPAAVQVDGEALGDQPVNMPGAAELGRDEGSDNPTAGDGSTDPEDAADDPDDAAAESAAPIDPAYETYRAAAEAAASSSWPHQSDSTAADAGGGADTRANDDTDIVTVTAKGDVKLYVPAGASLQVESASGDLSVRGVYGGITVGEAHGDAAFTKVASLSVATVRGDFATSDASGDVAVSRVMGDAAVRQVDGNLSLGTVGGDMALSQADGDVSAQAAGDAALRLVALPGRHYSIRAGGDIACALGSDSNVTLAVHAASGRLALAVGKATVERHGPMATIVVGEGLGAMSLDAGGKLALRASPSDGADRERYDGHTDGEHHVRAEFRFDGELGDLESQISEKFEAAASVLEQTLAGLGLSDEERERVVDKVRSAGERAGERAQSRVARAMQKMERQLERVRERAERRESHLSGRRSMSWSWGAEHGPHAPHAPHAPHPPQPPQPPRGPRPPMPPRPFDGPPGPKSVLGVWRTQTGTSGEAQKSSPPVTDEERMTVLKMVGEGKITPAQGAELLAAMEGQGDGK